MKDVCFYCTGALGEKVFKSVSGKSICQCCKNKMKRINHNKKMMKYYRLGYQFAIDYFKEKINRL